MDLHLFDHHRLFGRLSVFDGKVQQHVNDGLIA